MLMAVLPELDFQDSLYKNLWQFDELVKMIIMDNI